MKKIAYARFVLVLVTASSCSNALADGADYVTNFAENYTAINAASAAIGGKIVAAISALQQALSGSSGAIADAKNVQQVANAKNLAMAKAAINLQPPPNACGSRSVAQYAGAMHQGKVAVAGAMSAADHIALKNSPPPQVQNVQTAANHAKKYCNASTDPDCPSGSTPSTNGHGEPMVNSDTEAATLFTGAGDNTQASHQAALTYTTQQIQAAQDFIHNGTQSGDTPPKLSGGNATTDSGRQYEGLRLAYEARTGIAQSVLDDILASRTPLPGSSNVLDAINSTALDGSPGVGTWLQNRIAKIKSEASGGISDAALLNLSVEKRYSNPDWYKEVNETTGDGLIKELLYSVATLTEVEYRRYALEEKTAALQAETALGAIKSEMLPELSQARLLAENPGSSRN